MRNYRVVFTLRQRPTTEFVAKAANGRDRIFTRSNKPEVRGIDVEASCELAAISTAQFQLKRAAGFDVGWIDKMPEQFGLHFLHEIRWDISIREIPK
jgi:hypothetical protein